MQDDERYYEGKDADEFIIGKGQLTENSWK